jgi:hypothetical protein
MKRCRREVWSRCGDPERECSFNHQVSLLDLVREKKVASFRN